MCNIQNEVTRAEEKHYALRFFRSLRLVSKTALPCFVRNVRSNFEWGRGRREHAREARCPKDAKAPVRHVAAPQAMHPFHLCQVSDGEEEDLGEERFVDRDQGWFLGQIVV